MSCSKIPSQYWYWYWGIGVSASIGIGLGIENFIEPGIGIGIGIDFRSIESIGIGIGIDLGPVRGIGIGIGLAKLVLSVSVSYLKSLGHYRSGSYFGLHYILGHITSWLPHQLMTKPRFYFVPTFFLYVVVKFVELTWYIRQDPICENKWNFFFNSFFAMI